MAEVVTEAEGTRADESRSGAALRARLLSTGASLLALAIAVAYFSIKSDRFLSGPNLLRARQKPPGKRTCLTTFPLRAVLPGSRRDMLFS